METMSPSPTPPGHYLVLAQLFQRYADLAVLHESALSTLAPRCQAPALSALCQEAISNGHTYPFDKMNRWLGFTQGVLAAVGVIDVDDERGITRPLLHQLHPVAIKTWPPE